MNDIVNDGSILAIIIALNSLAGIYIESKFLPIMAVLFGVILTVGLHGLSFPFVVSGIVYGLIACGLFDQSKILK